MSNYQTKVKTYIRKDSWPNFEFVHVYDNDIDCEPIIGCELKYQFLNRSLTIKERWKLFLYKHPFIHQLFCAHLRQNYLALSKTEKITQCGKCGKKFNNISSY